MLKITIPTPCHEDWNKMTPDNTGRHCNACSKSVIDFTVMSDEEVKYFFLNKKEDEKVCGRFKQTQLHCIVIELPQNIFHMQMPLWKKFLAACLVVFSTTLFSCETKIKGEPNIKPETQEIRSNATNEHIMLGGISSYALPDSVETVEVCMEPTVGITFVKPSEIDTVKLVKGDIDIVEIDSEPAKPLGTSPVTQQTNEIIFMGDSIYEEQPLKKPKADSSAKTKNPPKADSINCNTIKNYY